MSIIEFIRHNSLESLLKLKMCADPEDAAEGCLKVRESVAQTVFELPLEMVNLPLKRKVSMQTHINTRHLNPAFESRKKLNLREEDKVSVPVSYTHLTLPTICSV
eukprot:TRINITY_DN15957_c0_g1_i3.p5 TRINITY_DN15957_c0_g1~~TRINITY_DN15957_c0_g1_i3.p5  ORF type:complete len:105 (+),score=22.98 TRINITY_DN15957_c0_g1_i3:514-828(+)